MENRLTMETCQRRFDDLLPKLSDYPDFWATRNPDAVALIESHTGKMVSWKELSRATKAFAAKLLDLGLRRGDVVATSLALSKEHVYLMYACFRIGVVVAPLDLRLKTEEVDRSLEKIRPKAYFFLGKTPVTDFRPMVRDLMKSHRERIPHWVQFQAEKDGTLPGAVAVQDFARGIKLSYLKALVTGSLARAARKVEKRDPAVIIFTTGSTGQPKPALLSHESILVQCAGLAIAFGATSRERILINLPPSHVGCVTEELATVIYIGGTGVLIPVFKPEDSLKAIAKYRCTMLGQVPAQFNLEWLHPEYSRHDLSSLRLAIYGGQAVSREFLGKLARMAPHIGTGLGLTETSGFCTFTPHGAGADDIGKSLGFASPLCPISIREPMRPDGRAGEKLEPGSVGEICFEGPQVFSGYLNDAEATAHALSRDGVLYTGDMGSYDDTGLHLAGRRKHIIKPKGYQVFPTDVENFIAQALPSKIRNVACVGAPHEIFSEAIIAFVEGEGISDEEIHVAAKGLASYARPLHVEILPPGEMPLNRVAKTDYVQLKERAEGIVRELRNRGRWDGVV